MEQTQNHTCSRCQSEAVFSTAKLQASYGWMPCPNCGEVSHFAPQFGTQYQAASFHLHSKAVKLMQPPSPAKSSSGQPLDPVEHSVNSVVYPPSPSVEVGQAINGEGLSRSAYTEATAALDSSKPQRRSSGWLWIGGVGLLSLSLAIGGWGMFIQRDWMGARWPQTMPWLERFCVLLDCQVRPYQSLQEIDVQSSSLQWLQYGSSDYQLEFVLANRSKTMTVATPFVHLVLLSLNGDVLLRQKLGKKDLSNFPTILAPQAQWVAQMQIQLDLLAEGFDPKQVLFELTLSYE